MRAYGRVSVEFNITTGVRQGDVLAPTLFNLFFDSVIVYTMASHPNCGLKSPYNLGDELVGSRRKMRSSVLIQDLEYANDIALVSESMDALEEALRALDAVCSGVVSPSVVRRRRFSLFSPPPFMVLSPTLSS